MAAGVDLILGGTELELTGFLILCAVSFVGSLITASVGLGGGLPVIATMALFLAPAVLIPVHGVVQLGFNLGRVALMARHVLKSVLPVIDAALGAKLFVSLPVPVLQTVLALFVLYATWAPKFQAHTPGKMTFFAAGAVGAFATMFVGAACKDRHAVVATHAMLMTIQYCLKIVAFGFLGFAFASYVPLLIGRLACGFAGTWTGRHVLGKLPERVFRIGLKTVLTLLALRLLYGTAITLLI